MNWVPKIFQDLSKSFNTAYWKMYRLVRRPKSIQTALLVIMCWHTARLAWEVRDVGLEVTLILLYYLCRALRNTDMPAWLRPLRRLAVLIAPLLVAAQFTRDERLGRRLGALFQAVSHSPVFSGICWLGIGAAILAAERFAECWVRSHERRYLVSESGVLRTGGLSFLFELKEPQLVLAKIAGQVRSVDFFNLVAELRTVNGKLVKRFAARGTLACYERRLSAGKYVLHLANHNPGYWPISFDLEVSYEIKRPNPESPNPPTGNPPLNPRALLRGPATPNTVPPHLCPTAARAETVRDVSSPRWDEEVPEPVVLRRWWQRKPWRSRDR